MSSSTSTWPSQAALAPMPMVGIAIVARDLRGERLRHRLDHDREGAGVRHRAGVGLDRRPVGAVAALGAEAAERVDGLRGEPDMGHHRHAALRQEA